MKTEELLQKLGLSEKETKVYLALLSVASASAYNVAFKSGLKRPTVYLILDELRKKGLVRKIPHAKKTIFMANPPEEFLRNAERWLSVAKEKLPELIALAAQNTPQVKVLHYEGERGIRDLLKYGRERMRGKIYIGFYAQPERYSPELRVFIEDEMNADTEEFGISYRGIAPAHPTLAHYFNGTNSRYQFKTIPMEQYKSDTSVDIGDTFVRLVDVPELQGVIIENANFAKTLRQIFEIVWACLP